MIRPSSIFSFSTLRIRRRIGRSVVVAVLILALCEAATRWALAHGHLKPAPSLHALVNEQEREVMARPAPLWLLGNSTLFYGVDADKLQKETGVPLVKLTHGSATAHGSAVMVEYYLKRVHVKPQRIVYFVTSDDLNVNGIRADHSREYEAFCKSPYARPQEYLALWQCRTQIMTDMRNVTRKLVMPRRQRGATDAQTGMPIFNGNIRADLLYYEQLANRYHVDDKGIGELAAVVRRYGVRELAVVLLPTTDAYAKFHDEVAPQEPYDFVRRQVAQMCKENSLPFVDYGEPSHNYREFLDGCHLNEAGRARMTELLASRYDLFGAIAGSRVQPHALVE